MKIYDRLRSPGGFSFRFASDFICVGCLVCGHFMCSSVVGRFSGTELYVEFWDELKPGGIPIGFEKLLGVWSYYRFGRRSSR